MVAAAWAPPTPAPPATPAPAAAPAAAAIVSAPLAVLREAQFRAAALASEAELAAAAAADGGAFASLARGISGVAATLDALACAPPAPPARAAPTRLVLSVAGSPALSPAGAGAARSPHRRAGDALASPPPALAPAPAPAAGAEAAAPATPAPVAPPAPAPAPAPAAVSPDRTRFELVGPQRGVYYDASPAAWAIPQPLARDPYATYAEHQHQLQLQQAQAQAQAQFDAGGAAASAYLRRDVLAGGGGFAADSLLGEQRALASPGAGAAHAASPDRRFVRANW